MGRKSNKSKAAALMSAVRWQTAKPGKKAKAQSAALMAAERWKDTTAEDRTAEAKARSTEQWDAVPASRRQAHARMMAAARWGKPPEPPAKVKTTRANKLIGKLLAASEPAKRRGRPPKNAETDFVREAKQAAAALKLPEPDMPAQTRTPVTAVGIAERVKRSLTARRKKRESDGH